MPPSTSAKTRSGWKKDPQAVKANILQVATEEFAMSGLSGARINVIADKTNTSKRMIYYYFENKETLYLQVLEAAYAEMRRSEAELRLTGLQPCDALRRLVEFTFDHHREHPDFIRLVMIENIHHGKYLKQSAVIRSMNSSAISLLEDICNRGKADGTFRADIEPMALHFQISALCFYNVANRSSFSAIFDKSFFSEQGQLVLRENIVQAVLAGVVGTI
ncbi:MAG: TetR/AcrR family transcriptional regulator [Thiolinea sp.]